MSAPAGVGGSFRPLSGLLTALLLGATGTIAAALGSRLGWLRAVALAFAVSFIVASAVALILLDLDMLRYGPLLAGLAVGLGSVSAAAWWWRARLATPPTSNPTRRELGWLWAGLTIVVLGTALRLDPSPFLHGGQDQGIYVNVGHHMARTGRLRPRDRLMAGEVPGVDPADVFEAHRIEPIQPGSPLEGVREGRWIAGLHVEDASEGRLVPGFFHLLPAWFAMCELDWGFESSTWALVYFWWLSGIAAFGAARRFALGLRDPTELQASQRHVAGLAGCLAALGLALHPLDLWISTFTVTENLARPLVLLSAWLALEAFAIDHEARARPRNAHPAVVIAVVSGLVFTAAIFTRGSYVAHAIALVGALAFLPTKAPHVRRALLMTVTVGATLAVIQAIAHSWPYFFSAASNHFHVPRIHPFQGEAMGWTLAAGAAVIIVDVALDRVLHHRRDARVLVLVERVGALLLLAGVMAAAVFHALDGDNPWNAAQQVVSVLARHGGALGIALGLAGLIVASWRFADERLAWVLLGAEMLLATALKPGLRYEFYYARYLVADAIPVLMVAAACVTAAATINVGAASLHGLDDPPHTHEHRRRAVRMGLGLVLGLGWIVPPLRVLRRPVYWTRDLHDTPAQLTDMFGHIPDDAILFFDARAPGRWRGILATPALLSFDRNVLVYPSLRFVEKAVKHGAPVYFISGGWEETDLQRWPNTEHGPFYAQVVTRGRYLAERAEVVEGDAPRGLVDWGGPYEILRIDPSIWRSSGAFTLFPGSAFIEVRDTSLRTRPMPLRWEIGGRVELWLRESMPACELAASLEHERARDSGAAERPIPLERLPGDNPRVVLFAMPSGPGSSPGSASIHVEASCPDGSSMPWHHLSMRWERR